MRVSLIQPIRTVRAMTPNSRARRPPLGRR
jgi:hypothetical protein